METDAATIMSYAAIPVGFEPVFGTLERSYGRTLGRGQHSGSESLTTNAGEGSESAHLRENHTSASPAQVHRLLSLPLFVSDNASSDESIPGLLKLGMRLPVGPRRPPEATMEEYGS